VITLLTFFPEEVLSDEIENGTGTVDRIDVRYRLEFVCRPMKKHIDIKSLLIGFFLASTVLLGIAATSPTDKWDNAQKWEVRACGRGILAFWMADVGWEPFAVQGDQVFFRKRIKDWLIAP
jgi:hypothetical protein